FAHDDCNFGHGDERHRVHPVDHLTRHAAYFTLEADEEARHVDQIYEWYVERIAEHHEARDLLARVGIERSAFEERVVRDEAYALAIEPRERRGDRFTVALFQLEHRIAIRDRAYHVTHVVHFVPRLRNDLEH